MGKKFHLYMLEVSLGTSDSPMTRSGFTNSPQSPSWRLFYFIFSYEHTSFFFKLLLSDQTSFFDLHLESNICILLNVKLHELLSIVVPICFILQGKLFGYFFWRILFELLSTDLFVSFYEGCT